MQIILSKKIGFPCSSQGSLFIERLARDDNRKQIFILFSDEKLPSTDTIVGGRDTKSEHNLHTSFDLLQL